MQECSESEQLKEGVLRELQNFIKEYSGEIGIVSTDLSKRNGAVSQNTFKGDCQQKNRE